VLPVAVARGPPLTTIRCYALYGFVDDVTFSHNEAKWSESKTTRMLSPLRQMAAPGSEVCCFLRFDCISLTLTLDCRYKMTDHSH